MAAQEKDVSTVAIPETETAEALAIELRPWNLSPIFQQMMIDIILARNTPIPPGGSSDSPRLSPRPSPATASAAAIVAGPK